MRIEDVRVDTVAVPFRRPVLSAKHRWDVRRLSLVRLTTDEGLQGLGEYAAPEPDDLGDDVGPQLRTALEGLHLGDPVALERALRRIGEWPFVGRVAVAAVESSLVDLLARYRGVSIARSFVAAPATSVAVNGLIGVDDPATAAEAAGALVVAGFGCLKLKAGDEPIEVLDSRVAAVRDTVGSAVALRVDFNGALTRDGAPAVLERLARHDLEYAEQPIAPSAGAAALAGLRKDVAVPIAADEAVRDLGSVRTLIDAGAVDALVVKPARVGGLRQAASIVALANEADVPITVSTFFESGVGIAGGLHLAATVPGSHAHGLATGDLLTSDLLREPLSVADGRMAVPQGPGLDVTVDDDAVERMRAV